MTKMNPKVQKVLDRILESFASGDVPEALTIVTLPKLDVPCSLKSDTLAYSGKSKMLFGTVFSSSVPRCVPLDE